MIRSMLAAISALRNHQTFMDVISNNIANVNTPGFKFSRVSFQDLLVQTLRGPSAPQGGRGGVNPMQVGIGMALRSIDQSVTQGDLQPTGKTTDLAIQGDGYFILNDSQRDLYTRDGGFDVGNDGRLSNTATGMKVRGYVADAQGVIDSSQAPTDLIIPLEATTAAVPTTTASLGGNLNSSAAADATSLTQATLSVVDDLGNTTNVSLQFTKSPTASTWGVTTPTAGLTLAPATISFNAAGGASAGRLAAPPDGILTLTNSTTGQAITINISGLTQFSQSSSINITQQNGRQAGSLLNFTLSSIGEIVGSFSNGANRVLGRLALARFPNPGGLTKLGSNTYEPSPASGLPLIGAPDSGGRGTITSGVLEMSNVNLAQQFTQMIMAQRGFQANARLITTSDEMLTDLINLKR